MKTLICKCGRDILVDDIVYPSVYRFQWRCNQAGRVSACCGVGLAATVCKIFNITIPPGHIHEHRDRNGHNNLSENIRSATHSQNRANQKLPCTNTIGYKWVYEYPKSFGYVMRKDGKVHSKAGFTTMREAAEAANVKAKTLFGEFAYQNVI